MTRPAVPMVAAVLLIPEICGQELRETPDDFTALAIGKGGPVGGRSIASDFRITRYANNQEVENLAAVLKEKGTNDRRRALEKLDVGRINPIGTVGNPIAVARQRQVGANTLITIVTARNMPFLELYRSGRTTDCPFGFLQEKLDAKGQGVGQIMAAARIRFDKKKGQYEIESYGNQYIKAANVRPLK